MCAKVEVDVDEKNQPQVNSRVVFINEINARWSSVGSERFVRAVEISNFEGDLIFRDS